MKCCFALRARSEQSCGKSLRELEFESKNTTCPAGFNEQDQLVYSCLCCARIACSLLRAAVAAAQYFSGCGVNGGVIYISNWGDMLSACSSRSRCKLPHVQKLQKYHTKWWVPIYSSQRARKRLSASHAPCECVPCMAQLHCSRSPCFSRIVVAAHKRRMLQSPRRHFIHVIAKQKIKFTCC